MSDYFNVTTNVGDAAIATAIANNSKLNITHIAFGDGNGSVPTPTKTRTSLVREVHRQAVTKYAMHPTIANYIVIETIIPSNIGGFWIREIGIIADNVLISHGSHAPFFKVADPDGVSEYRLKFTQNVRDGNVVEISLDESLIYASQAWVNENYIRRNELVDNLTTDDAKKPVSAKQAKNLQDNKLDKTANAVSATKLKNARKINTIDFDGMQDINIEAPLRFAGHITTLEQLNAAVVDGKYTVSELDIAGIYNYGFLVVLRSGGICHQVYYPHLGSPINNATMAMRQTWNMNGNIASWSEWRVVGTRDDSKLPLAGGTLTGPLTMNTAEAQFHHHSSGRYLYINNGGWGVYSPQGYIPLPVGSGGTGNSNGRAPSADRLATPRNIFGQTFDGSSDVGGTVTASTGLVQADSFHYIDMGRSGLDRMSFYNYGATFNFIDSQNGNVVARITSNGIDCNAASATDCSRSVIAGNGLSGGGALTSNSTVTLGTPGNITATSTNSVTETSHTHNLDVNSLPFLGTGINKRKSIISGTTYTNTGNRPIFVTCSMSGSSSNAASATLDGRLIFSTSSSNQYSQSFVVGVGVSYSFTGNNLVCEEYS